MAGEAIEDVVDERTMRVFNSIKDQFNARRLLMTTAEAADRRPKNTAWVYSEWALWEETSTL